MPPQAPQKLPGLSVEQGQGCAFTGGGEQAPVRTHGHPAYKGRTGTFIDLVRYAAQDIHIAR